MARKKKQETGKKQKKLKLSYLKSDQNIKVSNVLITFCVLEEKNQEKAKLHSHSNLYAAPYVCSSKILQKANFLLFLYMHCPKTSNIQLSLFLNMQCPKTSNIQLSSIFKHALSKNIQYTTPVTANEPN